MPNHKERLDHVTLSELETLTGFTRRTVRKRLAGLKPIRSSGRALYFDPREALPRLYLGQEGSLDLSQERAWLARAQREQLDLKMAEARGELISADRVSRQGARRAIRVRDALLRVATRVAPRIAMKAQQVCQDEVLREIREALTALSDNAQAIEAEVDREIEVGEAAA